MAVPETYPGYCLRSLVGDCPFGINCRKSHDIQWCECGLIIKCKNYRPHVRGKRHALLLYKARQDAQAESSRGSSDSSPQGRSGSAANGATNTPAPKFCEQCRKNVPAAEYDDHTEDHRRKQRQAEIQAALEEAEQDKEGVLVECKTGIDFGILEAESAVEYTITIENTNPRSGVSLQSCRMRSSNRGDEHGKKFSARLKGKSKFIKQGVLRTLSILMHPSYAGHYEDTLELVFFHLELRRTFVITRRICGTVGSREDHEQLKPKEPYAKKKLTLFRPDGNVIPSIRPPVWTRIKWAQGLPKYPVPKPLIEAAFGPHSHNSNAVRAAVKRWMPSAFNPVTYGSWFQALVYLEEEQSRLLLDMYSLENVELKANHPRYDLEVKGLAENRPSVLVGDYILVSHTDTADDGTRRNWFEGRVHNVLLNRVSLRFGEEFSVYKGNKVDVKFVLNQLPYRRMHHALSNSFRPARLLFPGPEHLRGARRVTQAQINMISPINRLLREDDEQMETVAAILNQKPGSIPFVLFGPPGTGKTVTIVEAMQQLLLLNPDVRILACAPNNSAADLLAQKLTNLGRQAVFRLNALSRKHDDLPKSLREFALINENKVFSVPTLEEMKKYRVVVSTCISGGIPASLGLKRGHFTHIFIDEAGQGKEPEIMVPIKSIANDETNIILAGDNKQLGPVVHSQLAGNLGLRVSYLARIMDREIYDLKNGGSGVTIVKLVKNFRSHPSILQFSNTHFYNSELQPCGDAALTRSLENYEELPRKKFPVIFHGIIGKDDREASSPSFFNIDEATQVKKYCLSLISNRKNSIRAEDIGVITPYHAQRCKILDLLRKDFRMQDIKVGSVEEFQGQERRIIIMSTVRSNTNYVTSDIKRSLGFVANARRLNVAITRAQALLIVIGNPIVLSLDPLWRELLNYIHINGGWEGKQLDWNPEEAVSAEARFAEDRRTNAEREAEETIQRLKAMIVQRHEDSDLEIDFDDDDDDDEAAAFERPIIRESE